MAKVISPLPSGESVMSSAPKQSIFERAAIVLQLNKAVVQDLQECARQGHAVKLLGGRTPKLQYGPRSTALVIQPETGTHEIYRGSELDGLSYIGSVDQRLTIPNHSRPSEQTPTGTDDALAELKRSLNKYNEEKEANQATISSTVIPSNRSSKILSGRPIPGPTRSAKITIQEQPAPPRTARSAQQTPTNASKKMTTVLVHYLALGPQQDSAIYKTTAIPRKQREEILARLATYDAASKVWTLKDKAYKDLDIWKFAYDPALRGKVVDSAVRAFDRMRLGKDDKMWQMLLPEKERGKGKCLSRLHNASYLSAANALRSPLHLGSPLGALSDTEAKLSNGRLTPRPTSTPTASTASIPGKGLSIEKRLKESQRQHAAAAAKAAKSSRPSSTGPAKALEGSGDNSKDKAQHKSSNTASKFKSAEVVHSSDDESEADTQPLAARGQLPRQKPRVKPLGSGLSSADTSRPSSKGEDKSGHEESAGRQGDQMNIAKQATQVRKRGGATLTASARTAGVASSDEGLIPTKKAPRSAITKSAATPSKSGQSRISGGGTSMFGGLERSSQMVKKVSPGSGPAIASDPAALGKSAVRNAQQTRPISNAIPGGATPSESPGPRGHSSQSSQKDKPNRKRPASEMTLDARDNEQRTTVAKHRRTESSSTQSQGQSSWSGQSHTTTARTSVASPSLSIHARQWSGSPSNSCSAQSSSDNTCSQKLSIKQAADNAEHYIGAYPAYLDLHQRLKKMKPEDRPRGEMDKLLRMYEELSELKNQIVWAAS